MAVGKSGRGESGWEAPQWSAEPRGLGEGLEVSRLVLYYEGRTGRIGGRNRRGCEKARTRG